MTMKGFAICIAMAAAAGPARAAWPTDPNVNVGVAVAANVQAPFGVLRDGAGGNYFVWFDSRNGDFTNGQIYAQRLDANGNTAWVTNGIPLTALFNAQSGGWGCAEDPAGGAIVAWFLSDGTLRAQKVNGSGTRLWDPNGVVVTTSIGGPGFSMCDDGAGGAIFSWTVGTDIFAQRIGAGGGPQWAPNGNQITAGAVAGRNWAVSDGFGGAIVGWTDSRAGQLDVYAQRVNASGGWMWMASGSPVATSSTGEALAPGVEGTGGRQFITPDGTGGAFFAFVQPAHQGIPTQVYAQRLDSAGSSHWGNGGHPLANLNSIQDHPVALSDGSGGVYIAWEDTRSGGPQIFAQRLSQGGGNTWTSDGILVAPENAELPLIISDGAGGALIGFATSSEDLFAQRVDSGGATLWGAAGIAVSTAAGIQAAGFAAPGACGMTLAWRDTRNSSTDVYGQGVNVTGTLGCPTVSVDQDAAQTQGTRIVGTFPNPSSPMTSISYSLGYRTHATLSVVDAGGRLVRRLVDGDQAPGLHKVLWDGSDDRHQNVPSGIYWAVLGGGTVPAQAYRMTLVH